MQTISEQDVMERLSFDNPWWDGVSGIDRMLKEYPKRAYFDAFFELVADVEVRRAVILLGPRRVGKTVMVYQSIQKLLDEHTPANRVVYISMETPTYTGYSLEKLLKLFMGKFAHQRDASLFVYFDEIQYLKDWEIHLKSLVDSFPHFNFVATGSAAAALRLKSRESGAGRFTDFQLPPLTFAEYLRFIKRYDEFTPLLENPSRTSNIDELNREFVNYLNYGGFPEAVFSERIKNEGSRYIKSDIIDKVLLRDLPSLYGIDDIQDLNRLFTMIAYNTGGEFSLENLSRDSGVVKNTIKRYLEYLEAAFLIKVVHRIDRSAKHFKRAVTFKVYLTNPSMRAALFGYVKADSLTMGALTETAIFSQYLHSPMSNSLYYSRWDRGEIDIVWLSGQQKVIQATEVKWTDRPFEDVGEVNNLIGFAREHGLKEPNACMTTLTKSGSKTYGDVTIYFIPSSLYACTIADIGHLLHKMKP